jgi:predicted ferric reductase
VISLVSPGAGKCFELCCHRSSQLGRERPEAEQFGQPEAICCEADHSRSSDIEAVASDRVLPGGEALAQRGEQAVVCSGHACDERGAETLVSVTRLITAGVDRRPEIGTGKGTRSLAIAAVTSEITLEGRVQLLHHRCNKSSPRGKVVEDAALGDTCLACGGLEREVGNPVAQDHLLGGVQDPLAGLGRPCHPARIAELLYRLDGIVPVRPVHSWRPASSQGPHVLSCDAHPLGRGLPRLGTSNEISSVAMSPIVAPQGPAHRVAASSRTTGGQGRLTATGRGTPRPHPLLLDIACGLAGLGLGATVGLAITAETHSQLVAPGGAAIFLGNLSALVGTYLALLMVLLVSRIGAIEATVGQARLVRWHRRLGPWPLSLIAVHAFLTTIGYAEAAKTGFFAELGTFLASFPYLLGATVGFCLMMAAGVASIRAIRTRMRRETWWTIHLYLYLGLSLSFAHEIALGPSFVGHPITVAVWSIAWALTAGLVLTYRIGLPVWRTLYYRLEVAGVQEEAPGVVSVICRGRHLERLPVSGGQFLFWRFLTRGMWLQAHPYSLSALPEPPFLRITVRAVGDHSAGLGRLRVGTRVAIEGPYGVFTAAVRDKERAALIAGGIGVTALRSLLQELPGSAQPVVILRASRAEDVVFGPEIDDLVAARRGKLHLLVGSRDDHRLEGTDLLHLIPDLKRRDIYLVGPEAFVAHLLRELRTAGIDPATVHHEAFSL